MKEVTEDEIDTGRMHLRKELFWDSDFTQINTETHKDLIIQRIVDHGTWEEFIDMLDHYGSKNAVESLQENTELSERGVYFVSHFFGKRLTDFKCYVRRQSIPIHFSF